MGETDIPVIPATIAQLPFFASGRYPKADLVGRCTESGVEAVSGRELVERVRDLGLGLTELGLAHGDRVALLSESRPEWLIADFAVLAAGAVVVPIYPTLSAEQVAFILRDAEVRLAIVSSAEQRAKVMAAAPLLRSLSAVIALDPAADAAMPAPVRVLTLREVSDAGHRRILDGWGVAKAFQDRAKAVAPSDLATIIYTSGTTGEPKGVMLTHANLVANLGGITDVLTLRPDDVALSFLPLGHGFERMVSYVYMATGVSMIFAESIETIARDLRTVRPTVMSGVPRVFEKLHARVLAAGRESRGLRRAVFERALRTADARARRLASGRRLPLWLRIQSRLADAAVFQRIRDGLGGRLRFAVSGSASLRPDLARFFYGVGLPILEGYGLTETGPVISVVPLEAVRFGTVGPPLPNVEVRLADDGEILARGPNVMTGYFRRPDDTAAVLRDGWFHTGDIGAFDEAGYLRITGRKKELIVTSGGKKIAPQPIESALRAHPLIQEAVVVGERRHFAGALLVPDFAVLARRLQGVLPEDPAARGEVLRRDDVQGWFQAAVDAANAGLARFEQIKRFALLSRELTAEAGELTPTLKVKRRIVEARYQEDIERLYRS
jgi:long-chain acyl-CoA synthetase